MRHNHGNAFTKAGHGRTGRSSTVTKHEKSKSHINARLLRLLIVRTINQLMLGATRKPPKFYVGTWKRVVEANCGILKCATGTIIHLGEQGLAYRGN